MKKLFSRLLSLALCLVLLTGMGTLVTADNNETDILPDTGFDAFTREELEEMVASFGDFDTPEFQEGVAALEELLPPEMFEEFSVVLNALIEALDEAKAVLANADATDEEIDNAALGLVDASYELLLLMQEWGMFDFIPYGDLDMDGEITSTDARLALQVATGKIDGEELDLFGADVDGDGEITSTDARLILQYSVGKIDHFPVEEMDFDRDDTEWF